MKMLIVALLLCVTTANAGEISGQLFMGSSGGDPGIDRAVVGVTQGLDAGWQVKVAGDGAGTGSLHEASLKGALAGGEVSVGYQQDVYAAAMEGALKTRWLAKPYSNVIADRDMSASYSGALLGVGYALQASDGVKADHKQAYGLLLTTNLTEGAALALGSRYDQASQAWTSNAALLLSKKALTVAIEVAQTASSGKKVTSHGLTATYADLYKSVGLYAQILNVEQLAGKNSSLVGLTAPVNKSVNAAALLSHVDGGADDSVNLRLAASF